MIKMAALVSSTGTSFVRLREFILCVARHAPRTMLELLLLSPSSEHLALGATMDVGPLQTKPSLHDIVFVVLAYEDERRPGRSGAVAQRPIHDLCKNG